jgi:hypothetical protein
MSETVDQMIDDCRKLAAKRSASRRAERAAERERRAARQVGDDWGSRPVTASRCSAPVSCGRRRVASPAPSADRPRRAPCFQRKCMGLHLLAKRSGTGPRAVGKNPGQRPGGGEPR